MCKPLHHQRLRYTGLAVIIGTLGAAGFAVVGVYVGPDAIIGGALAAGASLLALARLLEQGDQGEKGGG